MELGIVGLPNVGKSTLFNALTAAGAAAANYPFCTIEPNVGVVEVPDQRLDVLTGMFQPRRTVPAVVRFVDIAGLVRGASRGEGLGNQFLGHIRAVDALVHVVRCFADTGVTHVEGGLDPLRDVEIINTELALADLESLERRAARTEKLARVGDKTARLEAQTLERLQAALSQGLPARTVQLPPEEEEIRRQLPLLTAKPVLYVANVGEADLPAGAGKAVEELRRYAEKEGAGLVVISARVEAELAELPDAERAEFLAEYGLEEPGLYQLAREGYRLLGLLTFFTAGEPEVRAWTIEHGTRAPQAAGKIHSDIERGFIRAEVVSYQDLLACGGMAAARERGQLRLEGKDYVVQDGDVVYFRFAV